MSVPSVNNAEFVLLATVPVVPLRLWTVGRKYGRQSNDNDNTDDNIIVIIVVNILILIVGVVFAMTCVCVCACLCAGVRVVVLVDGESFQCPEPVG